MDTPLHSRDKGTVKTVGFLRQTGCEEGEDGEISRQDDGCGFLNARGIIYTDYLEKGQTITGAYYESLLHRLSEKIKKKTSLFEKEKDPLLSRQRTGAHLRNFDGQNYGIEIRIITTSTVFARFGPQ